MSRTHGFNSPNRRSKRLLASGYYLPPQNEIDVPSDEDDIESVDSNISRSSFAAENRNVVYEESPTRQIFNRYRRRNHSGSPARSPVSVSRSVDATVNRITLKKETHAHKQALVTSEKTVYKSTRQRETVTNRSHTIHHLYGLQQDEDENNAGGEHVGRQSNVHSANMQQIDGSQASQGDVFKTPTILYRNTLQRHASSLSDDEIEGFESQVFNENHVSPNFSFLTMVYQTIVLLLTSASTFTWKGGMFVYKMTTKVLLLDTWLLTHGLGEKMTLLYPRKLFKLVLLALAIAVATYLVLSVPHLYKRVFLTKTTPIKGISPLEKGSENEVKHFEKYSKQLQEYQKSVQKVVEGLEYSLQQLEIKIVDRHSLLNTQLKKLERKHQQGIEEMKKTSERLTSVASVVDDSVTDKTKDMEVMLTQQLNLIQTKIEQVKREHQGAIQDIKQDINGRFQEVEIKSKDLQSKLDYFENYMTTLESKMGSVGSDARNLEVLVKQSYANATYLKEITDKSFTENFLLLLQKGSADSSKMSKSSHSHLALVFIEWLKVRGFVKEKDFSGVYDHMNKSFVDMMNEVKSEMDLKIKATLGGKNQQSSITLDSIATQKYSHQNLVTETMVKAWIREALEVYSADRIGMPDFALESSGGFIVNTRCSETYRHKTALVSIFGIPIYYDINTPRAIIQPNVLPGDCWAFQGTEGYVVIGLSAAIHPTSFTLEHIPKSLALYNNISSAPKDFTVYGLNEPTDLEGNLLGIFRYEESGQAIQTFSIEPLHESGRNFSFIELRIASNWGHKDFTCLYRFRVHGVKA